MRKNDILSIVSRDILLALVLLTRLPLPRLPEAAFARQARAGWAFPLAGLAVAAPACALGALAARAGLPPAVAAGLVLAAQVMLSGAMHEDGLADSADGLWGGMTPARRLEIMKDSRVGSYGVLALILSVGLRWSALAGLAAAGAWGAVLAAAILSRAGLPALMTALPHARENGLSRAVGRPGRGPAWAAVALALIAALILTGAATLAAALWAGLAVAGTGALARARLGGQTGDILGAAQQLAEIAALISFLAVIPA
ncbi:adenosylcobinamide-GDP ribazoletransferase [Antarcticimicrobium luteum]|uniref:Adenosylcobinamide-GDP ribazoletransferase n=1 Tax=Antarcticimicrobium luteum TaxID=2547397 RepID=A0A4R5VGF6_9RHOB|nr:adenosylcobinamide-GDP ribazoletransferase [Antarcticimicrobium luteum]TDK51733.1 adenosylcobinamide-GDP ribazoletransferase [Antarcticimicrobium luteum]